MQQSEVKMLQKWYNESKLTLSEQLGDLVSNYDKDLAIKIYNDVGSSKTLALKIQKGENVSNILQNTSREELLQQLE